MLYRVIDTTPIQVDNTLLRRLMAALAISWNARALASTTLKPWPWKNFSRPHASSAIAVARVARRSLRSSPG